MLARRLLRPGFWLVFWREIDWLRRRPLLLAFITIVPMGLMAVLTLIFSAGLATRLPSLISTAPIFLARSSAWSMRPRTPPSQSGSENWRRDAA